MNARDIMTSPVISVAPHTHVREIAAILSKHRISGVPVLEGARLAGIVSESDLMHRHELGTDRPSRTPWWTWPFDVDKSPEEYVRTHATQARDIMTRKVLTVEDNAPVQRVADLLRRRGIRRVPVTRGTDVVGIVSRADLVRALAAAGGERAPSGVVSDEAIESQLLRELEHAPWWRMPYSLLRVSDGVVHFYGLAESRSERAAARVAAQNVRGVRGIEDHRLGFHDTRAML